MVWAMHAAQSGRPQVASDFLTFPAGAATGDLSSDYAVHPWKLETLLNEVLMIPKIKLRPNAPNRHLNCSTFSAINYICGLLNKLENAEDAQALARMSILVELGRIAQRQFEWQRGFLSLSQIYRSFYLYGGALTRQYFYETNGLTIDDFALGCLAIRTACLDKPAVRRAIDVDGIGITEDTIRATINKISILHAVARNRARVIRGGNDHISYKRSLLRDYPCIAFGSAGERVHAPLPDLILLKCTAGLFYDTINGGGNIRNEISARF